MLLRIILTNLLSHFSLGISVCLNFCLKFNTTQKCYYRTFLDNWTSIFILGVEFLRGRAPSWSLKHVNKALGQQLRYRRNIRINSFFIFGLAILRGRAPSCTTQSCSWATLRYLHVRISAWSFKQVKNAHGELVCLLRTFLDTLPFLFLALNLSAPAFLPRVLNKRKMLLDN